ncbi:hypothetical protein L0128_07765 [candidate division KSB1 bacterium]|nr:hypothetical protein [candidate division KSB1 bacterium]
MLLNCILGTVSIISWLLLFVPGLLIASKPYRDAIEAGVFSFSNFGMVLVTYTITNVALLCCLASIVGAATRVLVSIKEGENGGGLPKARQGNTETIVAIFAGLLRGFLIYLFFLAGVYLSTNTPFSATTPEQYARMAGTVSVMSFLVNYEPTFLKSFIAKAL